MIAAALLSPRFLMAAAVAVAIGVAYIKGRSDGAAPVKAELAIKQAAWADERTKAAEAARQQAERFLAKAQADAEQLDKVQSHAQTLIAAAQADRLAADQRASSLRATADLALNTLRRGTAEAPATAAECAAADTAARVFADLFGRADQVAGELASYADAARIAGQACVRADEVTR